MANPFEHDGDDDDRNARDEEELRRSVDAATNDEDFGLADLGDEDVEVDVSDDRDGAFDLDPPRDREGKRQNRFKEAQERAERERDLRMKAEAEAAALRALHTASGGVPRPPQEDPLAAEQESVYQERLALARSYNAQAAAGNLSDEESERFQRTARTLEEKSTRLAFRKMRIEEERSRDPREENIRRIQIQHPDVAGDSAAWNWADGRARQLLARGREYGPDLVSEVMEETRREFGMGKHKNRAPEDPKTRAALSSPRRGGGGSSPSMPTKIRMDDGMRAMADSAFPNIQSPAKRYRHWAQTVGKDFLEEERKSGR